MKILLVLAFAVFTGCRADVMGLEQVKPNMDMVKDAFWDYVAKATLTAEDTLQSIRQSELGQEVNIKIANNADAINQYTLAIRGQVTPTTLDLLNKFSQETEQLRVCLDQDLSSMASPLESYVQELQRKVEELKQDTTTYAKAMDSETMRATLLQKSEELRRSLERSMKELQAQLGPQTEELEEKMDKHLQEFGKYLAPFAEELREKLDPYSQDLRRQLSALWESFTKSSQ